MTTPAENLRSLMAYFGVSNKELAQALDIDPSLVSRWISGQRRISAASPPMEAMAEYFLSRSQRIDDVNWLKAQFEAAALPTDPSSVKRTKQNLIMWLASDGECLRRNLGSAAPEADKPQPQEKAAVMAGSGTVSVGCLDITLALKPLLRAIPQGGTVDVFLSNDQLATAVNGDVAELLQSIAGQANLTIRMVVCVSGDTQAMSRLIDAYMGSVISGRIRLFIVHGMTQTVTNQLHLILPEKAAVLVTETPSSAAPPVATIVTDADFVAEMQKSFAATFRYAQPILSIYGDEYTRNILEILFMEYCAPGDLDVVKDNINPMYMSREGYDRFLQTRGHSAEEYAWRSAEFARFKAGNDAVLQSGAVFREVIPLSRLHQIAREGFCRMPGLYFMERGYTNVDAQGCLDILDGYIRYMEAMPNFQLLILDDIAPLHADNCWHIKQNQSLALNDWSGDVPVMIHSDQILLIREFQSHFDKLWAKGAGAIGSRANVISILRDVAGQIERRTIR
ncbi:MAG: helix-turn-helix transcriptional regulator [Clostridia bacterium]|nr:helix-turn-helix transcriptional regulator [Clostridia bacterium]